MVDEPHRIIGSVESVSPLQNGGMVALCSAHSHFCRFSRTSPAFLVETLQVSLFQNIAELFCAKLSVSFGFSTRL